MFFFCAFFNGSDYNERYLGGGSEDACAAALHLFSFFDVMEVAPHLPQGPWPCVLPAKIAAVVCVCVCVCVRARARVRVCWAR